MFHVQELGKKPAGAKPQTAVRVPASTLLSLRINGLRAQLSNLGGNPNTSILSFSNNRGLSQIICDMTTQRFV